MQDAFSHWTYVLGAGWEEALIGLIVGLTCVTLLKQAALWIAEERGFIDAEDI